MRNKKNMSWHSYILRIMLWHQSLKNIHYRTLLIFLNKKKQQIWGSKHGGGIKDMLSPPCQNMGGIYHPHPPQDLRPCYIVNVMRSPVIERLIVRGSQVALKHVIHDMVTRTLGMEMHRRVIKKWVPCGDMDRRLKIPHSAKVECGFRTTPEECIYDSGLIGLQYRVS